MKIRAQITMIMNLDKCLGCHTCSVTCKNVWTSRKGMEYVWFNNVETKPGIGYPDHWENQERYKGGWKLAGKKLSPRMGTKAGIMKNIFANPDMPRIGDYYEPFTFNYKILHSGSRFKTPPSARPYSVMTGQPMDKIRKSANWDDNLGGTFERRSADKNFDNIQKEIYGAFENSFMMYLPRLCEHCLNPSCVAVCPSGAIYKREEDGIVLIDQNRCRGWRQCVTGCPYKKVYFNWETRKSEKCTFCYPKIEVGEPTICSESCVGRIRYIGMLLYDADKILEAASAEEEQDLYQEHLGLFLDPNDPEVIAQAKQQGIPHNVLEAARRSPIYELAIRWKLAFPLHPEYRTLPMVWYIPPLSPIMQATDSGKLGVNGILPDLDALSIPNQYLANIFTAGDQVPIKTALRRMLAMRAYMRSKTVDGVENSEVLNGTGLTVADTEKMYQLLAIANFDDRFVIPTSHREEAKNVFDIKSSCGFSTDPGCDADKLRNLFGGF
ncbi:MAG: nitrate reductase subunit beta [Bacteroidales bacterium]|jgi:nitrate reductase beta subunit|nr:nitrate reductase subunit beta [Bacteroidales bacterium]NCU36346.1 nitrate reductase subunit beta [Candidatus Falkowbacteria bacterium]MDD2633046.1 nitrate reductase subunit beta [Bacteroidales bacterium]MDD3130657.1 nitrate reductase subunit beta [Bacteroidales bacterium]MDD3525538.1 nitrate reductase subunit beta [Bacteroidales bacterium]